MIYQEAFDYLWNSLAGATDLNATRRLKDYQKKRLRRALLGRSIRPYFLEASWTNPTGTAGEITVASTLPVTKPLIVLDGAIRTQFYTTSDDNNFKILLRRTAGDSRVQLSQVAIKDEHLLTPARLSVRNLGATLGYGNSWPLRWPVPLRLAPNELLQLQATVLTGGVPQGKTWVQFRALNVNNRAEEDAFVADLREAIAHNPQQRPLYLQMFTPGFSSIVFDGAAVTTKAQTREAPEHLLVLGYVALFARSTAGGQGTTCNPRWRLQADNGYTFSKEEIDVNCYAHAGPGLFWNELAHPFLLPKGSTLSASFTATTTIASTAEGLQNYIIFRCVSV